MPLLSPGDSTNDRFVGAIQLTHIFAKALHIWHGTDKDEAHPREREHFMTGWKRDLDDWRKRTGDQGGCCARYGLIADTLLETLSTNSHIMLILLTLRIRGSHGSTIDLLRHIRDLAVHQIASVMHWFQQGDFYGPGGLAYAHDYLVVNIAQVCLSIKTRVLMVDTLLCPFTRFVQICDRFMLRAALSRFANHPGRRYNVPYHQCAPCPGKYSSSSTSVCLRALSRCQSS